MLHSLPWIASTGDIFHHYGWNKILPLAQLESVRWTGKTYHSVLQYIMKDLGDLACSLLKMDANLYTNNPWLMTHHLTIVWGYDRLTWGYLRLGCEVPVPPSPWPHFGHSATGPHLWRFAAFCSHVTMLYGIFCQNSRIYFRFSAKLVRNE